MAAIGEEKGTRSKRKEKEDEEFVPAAIGDWTAAPVSSTAASRARPWQRRVKPCELARLPAAAAAAAGCRGFGYRGRTGKYKNTLPIPTSQLDIPIPGVPIPYPFAAGVDMGNGYGYPVATCKSAFHYVPEKVDGMLMLRTVPVG